MILSPGRPRGRTSFSTVRPPRPAATADRKSDWAVATLYNNVRIEGGNLVVAYRGSRPGWTGASQVFWNCRADTIRCDSPPTAMNWAVGCSARRRLGDGHWEFDQVPAEPPSFYRASFATASARPPWRIWTERVLASVLNRKELEH